jgi:cation diffusion facilitator family transporter
MEKQTDKQPAKRSEKLNAASISIIVNVFLIVMKLAVAVITGSLAILAELAHSFFDMIASIFAYTGIKKAEEPADETHHYGHEKFENLSSLAQTILIVITSVIIIYEALDRLASPKPIEATELGLIAMVVTIGVDYFVSKYLHKAGEEHGSSALEADAYHFTTDMLGAIAVIVGLAFVMAGFTMFDSIAAIFVALLMLWISYHLGKKSINALMDVSPPDVVMERICTVISSTPGVENFHKLKARNVGNKMLVEFHVHVSHCITVQEGHDISHNVKERLMAEFPNIKEVTIHVEPNHPKGNEKIIND